MIGQHQLVLMGSGFQISRLHLYLVSGVNLHCSRSHSEPMPRPDNFKNLNINIEVLNRSQERVEIKTMIQKKRSGQKSNEGYCNYHTNGDPITNKI